MQTQDVSFFSPSQNDIERKRRLAEQLAIQGQQPAQSQMVGNMVVPVSPWESLAKALQTAGAGYFEGQADREEKEKKEEALKTMAGALDTYGRSQDMTPTMLEGGETINWNPTSPEMSGKMYADALMRNPDTAQFGMQAQMGQMQAKQNMANELDLYKQKFPMELELARQKAAIEAQYRAPAAAPANVQTFEYLKKLPPEDRALFNAMVNKQNIDPETGQPIGPRKLSATEQKEVFEQLDKVDAGESVKSALTEAESIMSRDGVNGPKPYTGFGADARTAIARVPLIGDLVADKDRAAATTEMKNLVTEQALSNLKAIFGGNPTEGERQILLDLQALPTYTPQEQKAIISRAVQAANRRQAFAQQRVQQLESGDYFTQSLPYQIPGQPDQTTQGETKTVNGKTYTKIDGQWYEQ